MTRFPVALALAAGLSGAVALQANAASAPTASELAYRDYHEGVYAATECRGIALTPKDYMILEQRIAERAGGDVYTVRQLDMIQQAKVIINDAISSQGCGAEEVKAALIRYDALTSGTAQSSQK